MLRDDRSGHGTQEKLARELATARRAFEDFAYTVIHDITAPLRSIADSLASG